MFNIDSRNILILFSPGRRGNFLKNCFTLADDCADSRLKLNNDKLSLYLDAPWGHVDGLPNWSHKRIDEADNCEKYVHCGHFFEINDAPFGSDNTHIIKIRNNQDLERNLELEEFDNQQDAKHYEQSTLPDMFSSFEYDNFDYDILIDQERIKKKILSISDKISWNINETQVDRYLDYYFKQVISQGG
jgi:hypothetical protein